MWCSLLGNPGLHLKIYASNRIVVVVFFLSKEEIHIKWISQGMRKCRGCLFIGPTCAQECDFKKNWVVETTNSFEVTKLNILNLLTSDLQVSLYFQACSLNTMYHIMYIIHYIYKF